MFECTTGCFIGGFSCNIWDKLLILATILQSQCFLGSKFCLDNKWSVLQSWNSQFLSWFYFCYIAREIMFVIVILTLLLLWSIYVIWKCGNSFEDVYETNLSRPLRFSKYQSWVGLSKLSSNAGNVGGSSNPIIVCCLAVSSKWCHKMWYKNNWRKRVKRNLITK